jgi:hypothetical protein
MTPHPMFFRVLRTALGLIAVIASGTVLAQVSPDKFSEAEKRLFTDTHLKNVSAPSTIEYVFKKRGSLEPVVDDRVTLQLKSQTGDVKAVSVKFLSNERALSLPDLDDATSNPLIMFFLERDVREMNRLTKGSMSYYRKRLRMALAETARVRPTSAIVDGKTVKAIEVSIDPFKDDPARGRYEKFANKTYTFVLSEGAPGGIVELRSEMTERAATAPTDSPPIMVLESITFSGRGKL